MELLKIAVEQREGQLRRQINSQTNPMIKQILEAEILELNKQWNALQTKK